jgi:CpeT/CpcT family (DUF1001)
MALRPALFGVLFGVVVASCLCLPVHAQVAADPVARLLAALAGEWNNNEQVWQQNIDLADDKKRAAVVVVPAWHQLWVPLSGERMLMRQSDGTTGQANAVQKLAKFEFDAKLNVVKQSLHSWADKTLLTGPAPNAEQRQTLSTVPLLASADCVLLWRMDEVTQSFHATPEPGSCAAAATPGGGAVNLTGNAIAIGHNGAVLRLRQLRYFEAWVWIKHAGPNARADDKASSFMRKVLLHSEGQRVPVMFDDGSASPYLVELALLTYQNTRKPILKLALLDKETLKSVSYTWANPEATMIGMNLGWFQTGLTQKAERVNYGF